MDAGTGIDEPAASPLKEDRADNRDICAPRLGPSARMLWLLPARKRSTGADAGHAETGQEFVLTLPARPRMGTVVVAR